MFCSIFLILFSNARHPHVVLCFGASVDSSKMCIVTEFVKHDEAGNCANLRSWARTAYLDAGTITRVAKDIAKTMLFLHEQTPSILHRDLRPSNVLINKHNQPILVDFGLSCIFDTVGKSKKRNQQQLQDEDSFYEATAPEVIAGEPFSQKSDVWSFGLVLLELVLKRPPQHLRPDLLTSLIPEHCNQVHKSIISSCLRVDPDGRPSFGKIVDLLSLPEAGGVAVTGLDGGSPRGPTVANAHFPSSSSSSSAAAPLPLSSSFVASPADQDMMSPGSSSEAEMGSGTQTPCITLFAPSQMFPSSSTTMSSSSPSSGGPRYGKLSDFRYPGGSSSAGGFSGNGVSNAEMASASASGSAYGVGAGNPPLLFGQTRPQQQQQPQVLLIPPQQQIQHQQQQQQQNEKMSEDNESQKDSNAMSTSTYSVVDMEIQSTEDVKIITYPTN